MSLLNVDKLSELLKSFYTIDEKLKGMEDDLKEMRAEVSALRTTHSDLQSRVAALEEGRKTLDAQLRAVTAETVADLRVKFAEAMMELHRATPSQPPPLPGAPREGS